VTELSSVFSSRGLGLAVVGAHPSVLEVLWMGPGVQRLEQVSDLDLVHRRVALLQMRQRK
jgi:hypothetical protein